VKTLSDSNLHAGLRLRFQCHHPQTPLQDVWKRLLSLLRFGKLAFAGKTPKRALELHRKKNNCARHAFRGDDSRQIIAQSAHGTALDDDCMPCDNMCGLTAPRHVLTP
jgi:hypothetical protein